MKNECMNNNAIDDAAAAWVGRQDRGALTSAEHADFERWLAADARHRGAFVRAQSLWRSLDRLSILPADAVMLAAPSWPRRKLLAVGGGVALAAGLAVEFWPTGARIETPVGEVRRTPLGDGSVATINTNSAINVHMTPEMRQMTLFKGEAWFDVAKDHARPFVVTAGNVRVRAVGTAFSVRRRDDGADVLVTEGMVETWLANSLERKRRVSAGCKVFVSDVSGPSLVVEVPNRIDHALAWRAGQIVLDGETLSDAAAEFNRYNDRKITVDPALAGKRVVGWFRTNEPETFAAAAALTVKGRISNGDAEIHIAPDSDM
jgi:transmembrane sensor